MKIYYHPVSVPTKLINIFECYRLSVKAGMGNRRMELGKQ